MTAGKIAKGKDKDALIPEKVFSWPGLLRIEAIVSIVAIIVLCVWSILIDAPLEEAANPSVTPNPAKAPWYFLGLQELLVYFDPWIAGVLIPGLCIVGLMAIPYLDVNPKGNGYYTFKRRAFAISTFMFGFLGLWIIPIIIGVFFRGPGWNLFWPWEEWDIHKVVSQNNVNLGYMLGIRDYTQEAFFGLTFLAVWYIVPPLCFLKRNLKKFPTLEKMGIIRYVVTAFLFQSMMLVPLKIVARLIFHIKYFLVLPWFNV
jgi:hypothetical protein